MNDDGHLFIPNAKKILEILEKIKIYKSKAYPIEKYKDENDYGNINGNSNEQEIGEESENKVCYFKFIHL